MSKELFNLVKSLNKKEKIKFKKWSTIYASEYESQYIKLFDVLEKMETYEEKKLSASVSFKHLTTLKNYLYNSILACLRTHAKSAITRVELLELWVDTHVLLERGLVKQAHKRVEKAKKAAAQYHFDILSLELNFLERRIVRQSTKSSRIATKKINQLIAESQQKLVSIQADFELLDLYEALFAKIRYDRAHLKVEDFDLLQQPISENLSLNGIICYYFANSMLAAAQGDHQKKYELLQQLIQAFEQYDDLLKKDYDFQVRYTGFLNNYCVSCFQLGKLDEIPSVIHKFIQINALTDSFRLKSIIFQRKNNLQLAYWLTKGDYDAILEAVAAIESGINVYEQNLAANVKHRFYINIATAFLLKGKYRAASEYIHKTINAPQTEIKTSNRRTAYRIELQILFSEQEYEVLNFRLIAFKRKFKNYASTNDYKLAKALGKVLHDPASPALKQLHEELAPQEGEQAIKAWIAQVM
ncbi:MAG: hypothetical protein AAF847_09750 [Bacteroidota bacterium]